MRRNETRRTTKADDWLRANLSEKKFDELNATIFRTVPETYQREMEDVCQNLIENASILGTIYDCEDRGPAYKKYDPYLNEKIPKKDVSQMSDTELYMATVELEQAIRSQRERNEKLLQEVQLLDPAMRQLDLEKQGYFIELTNIERGII